MHDENAVLRGEPPVGRGGLAIEGVRNFFVGLRHVPIAPAGEIFAVEETDESRSGLKGVGAANSGDCGHCEREKNK